MSVLLSIIVPVYKIDEKLLGDCLSSLKRQKFQSVEFIVIDDGSPDNCGNICDTYGREDSRFKIIHTENLGVSNARNVGIESASGDYVVFVDGDDFVEDDLCEVLGNVAIANNDDIIFFYHVTTNNPRSTEIADGGIYSLSKEKIGELKKDIIEQRDTVPGVWIGPPWGKMYRRSIILDNNLRFVVGLRKSQDRVFVFDYLNNIKSASVLKYVGYHYVSNENSVCHRYNEKIVDILEMAGDEFEKRVVEDRLQYQNAIDTMYLIFICEYIILYYSNEKNPYGFINNSKNLKKLLSQTKYIQALSNGDKSCISRKRRLIIELLKYKQYLMCIIMARILF